VRKQMVLIRELPMPSLRYFRYSPLFYGYYLNDEWIGSSGFMKYPLPLAYFVATLIVFGCSFYAILRKYEFSIVDMIQR